MALTFFASAAAAQQQPCTTDTGRVVSELYRHMLERQPGQPAEHWQQELANGNMTVRQLVREIALSTEHMRSFGQTEAGEETPYYRAVGRMYRHILGRQPDPEGQREGAQLAQTRGLDAVVESLVQSQEYTNQYGDWGVPGSGGVTFCRPDRFTGINNNNNNNRRVATSGQLVTINPQVRWTDTGTNVRAGQMLTFDADGRIMLSNNGNDFAVPSGATSGRRADNAPLPNAPAGGLLARIGNGQPIYVGDRQSIRVPRNGRLYLGVNDDHLNDNQGEYRVTINIQ